MPAFSGTPVTDDATDPNIVVKKGGKFGGVPVDVSATPKATKKPYIPPSRFGYGSKKESPELAGVGTQLKEAGKVAVEGLGVIGDIGGSAIGLPTTEEITKTLGFTPAPKGAEAARVLGGFLPLPLGILGKGMTFAKEAAPKVIEDIPAALSKIEKLIAPASSTSKVGEKIESKLTTRLNDLIKNRREQFENVKNVYFDAGSKQGLQLVEDYKNLLQDTFAEGAAKGSADEQALAKKLWDRIQDRPVSLIDKEAGKVTPEFEVLEKERRFLNDIANGLKVEGAEGITANFARDMASKLETVIERRIPKEFNSFKETYKSLSEPINQYNRAVGSDVVKRADEYLPEVSKIDPAKIPDKVFQSKRSIDDLRAVSGDEKFVQQMAKEYVAVKLRNATTAEEIRNFMTNEKNYDLIQEFPEIKQSLESIAKNQKGKEIGASIAKWGALGAAGYFGAQGALNKVLGIFGD